MSGFRDAVTIKNIDDELIDKLETYIKDDIAAVLAKHENAANNGLTLDRTMFYGIYADDPSKFTISLGEKVQLKEVAKFAGKKFDNAGPSYFADKRKSKFVKVFRTVDCGNLGKMFISCDDHNDSRDHGSRDSIEKMKTSLYTDVVKMLKSKGINEIKLNQLSENMVSVAYSKGVLSGTVVCILCSTTEEKNFCVNVKVVEERIHWIYSNYLRHLREYHNSEISEQNDKKRKKAKPNNQNLKKSILENDGAIENIIIEEIDYKNLDINYIQKQIYDKISEQTLAIRTNCEVNNEKQFNMLFDCCGEYRTLKITRIQKNGNCLFGAIAHQLYKNKLGSSNHSKLTAELRSEAVSYISNNIPEFKVAIENQVHELFKGKKVPSMANEIQKFIDDLKIDGYWGGTECLHAVELLYKCSILIINEFGDFYFVGVPHDLENSLILVLAFRTKKGVDRTSKNIPNEDRNHYDSVTDIEQDDIYYISQVLSERIKKYQESNELMNDIIDLSQ